MNICFHFGSKWRSAKLYYRKRENRVWMWVFSRKSNEELYIFGFPCVHMSHLQWRNWAVRLMISAVTFSIRRWFRVTQHLRGHLFRIGVKPFWTKVPPSKTILNISCFRSFDNSWKCDFYEPTFACGHCGQLLSLAHIIHATCLQYITYSFGPIFDYNKCIRCLHKFYYQRRHTHTREGKKERTREERRETKNPRRIAIKYTISIGMMPKLYGNLLRERSKIYCLQVIVCRWETCLKLP